MKLIDCRNASPTVSANFIRYLLTRLGLRYTAWAAETLCGEEQRAGWSNRIGEMGYDPTNAILICNTSDDNSYLGGWIGPDTSLYNPSEHHTTFAVFGVSDASEFERLLGRMLNMKVFL